jgi:hypothetical protein
VQQIDLGGDRLGGIAGPERIYIAAPAPYVAAYREYLSPKLLHRSDTYRSNSALDKLSELLGIE